jgi:SAM-dependent methyltransferase
MFAQNIDHYYSVGASAMSSIYTALDLHKVETGNVRRILDYACGYGRVLRWLRAAFPEAYIKGVDADRASAEAAAVLNVETAHLDITLAERLGDKFDLIWVGSLFTHLTSTETARILRYLRSHLSDSGIIVFTTHGVDVFERVTAGERDYGLDAGGVEALIDGYTKVGYGYAGYPSQQGYGISIARPVIMNQLAVNSDLFPFMFRQQGWDNHQDVFACTVQ